MRHSGWLVAIGATLAIWSACGGDDAATTSGGSGTQATGGSSNSDASVTSGGMAGTGGSGDSDGSMMLTDAAATDGSACVEGKACTSGPDPGICRGGICSACTDIMDDAACVTAYGAGHLCVVGACVKASCRKDGDCGDGGKVCVDYTCNAGICKDDNACTDPTKPVCDVPTGTCVAAALACNGKAVGDACGGVGSKDHCCNVAALECKARECCNDTNCMNGQTCSLGTCANLAQCQSPLDHTYYVDATDMGTNGHTGSTTCPFTNLKTALDNITSNLENTNFNVTVIIRSALNEGNQGIGTFPIEVPSRILIRGENDAARPVITVPADKSGFVFSYPKPAGGPGFGGISQLVIQQPNVPTDATSGAGVLIKGTYQGDLTVNSNINVTHLDIQHFNEGIKIEPLGYGGIGPDISATHNNYGLYVADGYVHIAPYPQQLPNHFDNNRHYGIFVGGASVAQINGGNYAGDAAPAGKTVTANNNDYGVRFYSSELGSATLAQELTNVQASNNTTANVRVFAGMKLRVRNCEFKNNGTGIGLQIADYGTDDLSAIDFGTNVDPGGNVFFMNSPAVCIESKFVANTFFRLVGNSFAGHDCASPDADYMLTTAMDCSSGKIVGFLNHGTNTTWDIRVANCSHDPW